MLTAAFGLFADNAAAKYPRDTVTLITHSSPGSGSDVFLRELIKYLGPEMGVNFVVENVRGGSGAKAVAKLAQSPADGSVFYATTPTYIQTTLLSKPGFGYKDLDPVVIVFYDPNVIYARADSPFKSVKDAVEYAKKNPGKGKWGASNPASLERIVLEKLNRLTGAGAAVVSHEGGGDLIVNVLNGTLDIGVGEVQEILPQLEAGKVKLLGVLTEDRIRRYPDLPTVREQGYDIAVLKFRGLAGPKNLPADVVKAWEQAIQKVLENPQYKAKYESENLVPAFRGQEEARAFTTQFAEDVVASLRELGIIK
jgi:tripartite-type tricarboxylate transporter receptor subunit TctC